MHRCLQTSYAGGLARSITTRIIGVVVTVLEYMPAGVGISQGIVARVAVAVQVLRVARVGHNRVGLGEAAYRGVVVVGAGAGAMRLGRCGRGIELGLGKL